MQRQKLGIENENNAIFRQIDTAGKSDTYDDQQKSATNKLSTHPFQHRRQIGLRNKERNNRFTKSKSRVKQGPGMHQQHEMVSET